MNEQNKLPPFPHVDDMGSLSWTVAYYQNVERWRQAMVAQLEAILKLRNLSLETSVDLIPNLGKDVLEAMR